MSAHHQTRGALRHPNLVGGVAAPSHHYSPPAPTPLLKPTEVKRQFTQHADFQTYSKTVKKYLNGSITKTEFHAELSKVLPTKEKRTYAQSNFSNFNGIFYRQSVTLIGEKGEIRAVE
jgi:hypothetical protein